MRESLKSARRAAGLTQQAMADKLGISLRYYQQIEAGDRTGDFAIWDDLEDITGIHQRILRAVASLDLLIIPQANADFVSHSLLRHIGFLSCVLQILPH